jgi:predicted DsbA family dithiol-disulfide isomerase
MKTLRIDVWSDIACPWCFVGKRRLEAALEQFDHRDAVEVHWHAFELDPSAPRVLPSEPGYVERLARKYRCSPEQGQAMIDRMTQTAAKDGLDFRFDRIRPGNTFDAHRLLHLAHERGQQDAVKERFLAGYLEQGEPIGDKAALLRLAVDAGLDEAEVTDVLETDAYADEVRQDEATARTLGVTGVPFFVFGQRIGVSGAQPPETLKQILDQAWAQLDELQIVEGAACGPEGCD